jgi:peroxiredoxin
MRIDRALSLFGLVLAASVAGCGGSAAQSSASASATPAQGASVGKPAPNFSVGDVTNGNGKVALSDLRGQVVLVDFWGTLCEPCKKSFPKLQALHTRYAGHGLKIVGISEDDGGDKGSIPSFASSYGAKFMVGWDGDKSIARSYRPETMPSSFLIDKDGVVRYAHIGYHDGEEVEFEREIRDLIRQ